MSLPLPKAESRLEIDCECSPFAKGWEMSEVVQLRRAQKVRDEAMKCIALAMNGAISRELQYSGMLRVCHSQRQKGTSAGDMIVTKMPDLIGTPSLVSFFLFY